MLASVDRAVFIIDTVACRLDEEIVACRLALLPSRILNSEMAALMLAFRSRA